MKTREHLKNRSGPVWIRIAILAGIAIAVFLTLEFTGLRLSDFTHDKIRGFILGYGTWAPIIYIVVYALRSVALVVPAGILSFAGGLAFGKALGFLCIVIGSEAGACLAFMVCRIFGRPSVERFSWFRSGKIHDLDASSEANGFKTILYLRLMLIFPFDPINIAAGLSRIRFRDFALASFIGLIPASYIEAVLGSSLGNFRSPDFIFAAIAWVLMITVSFLYKKRRSRKNKTAPRSISIPRTGRDAPLKSGKPRKSK
jgi:uncharacterized membrane protein YdjX (TVP38/TMEM64 family)